ncbi:hypothetical protein ABZY19_08815 [Streptomyces sp. NPDC006475]|uniref:hypothetical protein n=1 Tax=Streptomyces sp. NPDC006475 TaxID=3155719 RepID=UPI0033AC3B6A
MADERYEWLDRKAAEQLLRGEPVRTSDEHARAQAAQLSRALFAAGRPEVPVHPEDGEMPGEAAALAAFRKSRADAEAGDALGTVRLAPSPCAALGVRLRRPVRFGIAALVAGCALGGVAVAAGTGLLPTPFGGGTPLPASSVSAAETPGPLLSESPDGAVSSPMQSPDPAPSPSAPPTESGGLVKDPDPTGTTTGPDGETSVRPEDGKDDAKSKRRAELYRRTVAACLAYRKGTLPPEHRKKLEIAAKGPGGVERFCAELLNRDAKSGGNDHSGSDGGGSDDGGNDDDKGGGDGSDSDGRPHDSTPPVSWTPPQQGTPRDASENGPQPSVDTLVSLF